MHGLINTHSPRATTVAGTFSRNIFKQSTDRSLYTCTIYITGMKHILHGQIEYIQALLRVQVISHLLNKINTNDEYQMNGVARYYLTTPETAPGTFRHNVTPVFLANAMVDDRNQPEKEFQFFFLKKRFPCGSRDIQQP